MHNDTVVHMIEEPHALDYKATLDRMEPGIAPIDPMISLASLAISLHGIHESMPGIRSDLMDLRYALNTLGSNNNINSTNMVLEKIREKLDYLSVLADMKINLEKIVKGLADG